MKRLINISLIAWVLVLSHGCIVVDAILENSGPLPRLPNWGYLTADMNGSDWSKTYKNAYQVTHGAISYLDKPQGVFYSISSMLYTAEGYNRQEMLFQNIPFSPQTGRHRVVSCNAYASCKSSNKPNVALFELLSDGDVSGDCFNTVDSEDNYIQIDSYNAERKEIKGHFQLTLANARIPRSSKALPDTLRFRNGRFHTKIIEFKGRGG